MPEELFGPYALSALERDEYVRQVDGYLPTAHVAFLDEIFKAGSATLNSLLSILNERIFHNGNAILSCPLITLIGASNERPEGPALEALADRFLIRVLVAPLSAEGFAALIQHGSAPAQPVQDPLTPAELATLRAEARSVPLSEDLTALLLDLRAHLQTQGEYVSDRRWLQVIRLLQVAARAQDQQSVSVWAGGLLPYCLSDTAEGQRRIQAWYTDRLGLTGQRLGALALEAWAERLTAAQGQAAQAVDREGHPLYLDRRGAPTLAPVGPRQRLTPDGEPLYLPPDLAPEDPRREAMALTASGLQRQAMKVGQRAYVYQDRARVPLDVYLADPLNVALTEGEHAPLTAPGGHDPVELADVDRQLADLAAGLRAEDASLRRLIAEAEARGADLWLTARFLDTAKRQMQSRRRGVEASLSRLASIRAGFSDLIVGAPILDPSSLDGQRGDDGAP